MQWRYFKVSVFRPCVWEHVHFQVPLSHSPWFRKWSPLHHRPFCQSPTSAFLIQLTSAWTRSNGHRQEEQAKRNDFNLQDPNCQILGGLRPWPHCTSTIRVRWRLQSMPVVARNTFEAQFWSNRRVSMKRLIIAVQSIHNAWPGLVWNLVTRSGFFPLGAFQDSFFGPFSPR